MGGERHEEDPQRQFGLLRLVRLEPMSAGSDAELRDWSQNDPVDDRLGQRALRDDHEQRADVHSAMTSTLYQTELIIGRTIGK